MKLKTVSIVILLLSMKMIVGCAPKQQSFSILMQELPIRVNPDDSSINYKLYVIKQLFEPLFVYNNAGIYESNVFTNWSAKNDHRQFMLCLREGLKFSNGKAVTPDHLKDNLLRLEKKGMIQKKINALNEDSGCLLVEFKEPYLRFPADMSSYGAALIDPETAHDNIVVGISDYRVENITSDAIHLTTQNKARRYSDIYFYKWTEHDESGKVKYKIDEIDDFNQIPVEFLPPVVSTFNKYEAPILTSLIVILNSQDKQIRNILFNCLNYDEMRRIFTPSRTTFKSIGGILPDGVVGALEEPPKQECNFAPLKKKIELAYVEALRPNSIPALQTYIDSRLLPLNIKVTVKRLEINELAEALMSKEKRFDITIVGMDAPTPDPYSFFQYFFDENMLATNVRNPTVADLMGDYLNANSLDEKRDISRKANQALLDNYQVIPLYQDDRIFYYPKRVRNINSDPLFLNMLKISEL